MAEQEKGTITEQKCPKCGGSMRYDPEKHRLICEYCDTVVEDDSCRSKHTLDEMKGFSYDALNKNIEVPDPDSLPIYLCESCGAEIIANPEEFALTCPYCRNNIVLTDKTSGNLRPNGVIPFEITTKNLAATMQEFYKDKKFLPDDYITQQKMSDITGIYVPFWVFDGDCKGEYSFTGTKVRRQRKGDYIYTYTSYYDAVRGLHCQFKDLPVDVSERMEDALMDSIQPYDMSKVEPYDIKYLAGFSADRFDVPKEQVEERVKGRVVTTAANIVSRNVGGGYTTTAYSGGSCKVNLDAKYILFPVYFFKLTYNGEEYEYAMNGQTGHLVGHVPIDKKKKRRYRLRRLAILAVAIVAAFVAAYFLGI